MAVLPTRWSTSPQPLPPLLIQPSSVSHRSLADLQAPCLISASESRPPDEGYSRDIARERWLHFADLRACVTSCAPFANAMHVTLAAGQSAFIPAVFSRVFCKLRCSRSVCCILYGLPARSSALPVTDATFDSHVGEPYMPPDILDYDTSTDMVVMEGRNVTLRCAATGSPAPNITWRREDGQQIQLGNGEEVASVDGPSFNITKVNRLHMGSYLCIASNGVPPSVSKRIMLTVHFPPMIWVQNQLVGAQEGQKLILECYSEAFPKSINYWTRDQDKIVPQGGKYDPVLKDNAYKIHMRLTINSVSPTDYGSYKCVSRNSLGDTDGSIKVYPISGSNSSITKYKGKARHNSGNNNILEGNQDMLKERDLKLRGRKENGGDVADYDESSATSNGSSLLLVILVALCLYLHHHPQMRTLHPA
ncbi:Protein CEPU-1 [Trachymyrmex septentrionalis]|uniref:Protein CEPU-1 n=1 Tax=Trachymyrmex septentrionalis TaxID=34720 RepID=A0A195F8P4_9HYME|nr:Protein CEPU-1 [Trachymyrmex septentrionalis]